MQALDSIISPIPDFDGDIPTPAIPVSARPPGDESTSDPSNGANASALKTQAGKQKATANPTPPKKARKTTGKSTCWIKINEPTPNVPASTPPLGPRWKIPIQRSKRYAHHEYIPSLIIFLICEPLCRMPQDINLDLRLTASPQRWTCPRVLKLRELCQVPRSPQTQKECEAPLVLTMLQLLQPVPP
jgi:hypothetical protein